MYTGDYSREEDRHLMAAEVPMGRVDVLICESTYGVQSHHPRIEREQRPSVVYVSRFIVESREIAPVGIELAVPD